MFPETQAVVNVSGNVICPASVSDCPPSFEAYQTCKRCRMKLPRCFRLAGQSIWTIEHSSWSPSTPIRTGLHPPPRRGRPGARRSSAAAGLPLPRPAGGGAPPGGGRRPGDRPVAPRRRARRAAPAHGHALRIVDRGAIFAAARHALGLHQWLTAPDFDQDGAIRRAEAASRGARAAGHPAARRGDGARAWLEAGGARAPMAGGADPALVRSGTSLLRAPVPLTGAGRAACRHGRARRTTRVRLS